MLETKVYRLPAEKFIEDPTLFDRVTQCWRQEQWLFLFGETPVGAVLASVDDGITFWYKVEAPSD